MAECTEGVLPCLQVASHLISGLSTAVEACARASSVSYGSHSIGPPSRVAVAKAAYTVSLWSRLMHSRRMHLLLHALRGGVIRHWWARYKAMHAGRTLQVCRCQEWI